MAAILSTAAKAILSKLGKSGIAKVAGTAAVGTAVGKVITKDTPQVPQLPGRTAGGAVLPGSGSSTGGAIGAGTIGPNTIGGMAVTKPPRFANKPVADPGYVVIQTGPNQYVQVLKKVAYALGLRKRPTKSTRISSRDIQGAHKVNRFIKKFAVGKQPRHQLKSGKRR